VSAHHPEAQSTSWFGVSPALLPSVVHDKFPLGIVESYARWTKTLRWYVLKDHHRHHWYVVREDGHVLMTEGKRPRRQWWRGAMNARATADLVIRETE
jgi:hypothetical protein